jgi:3-methyladenine DNA glycosylase Tag
MATAFKTIRRKAEQRKGGQAALARLLPKPLAPAKLRAIADDRWLAGMTRAIFNAGFNWKVVDAMWPGFEAAFEGFDPPRWRMMSDADLDRLVGDRQIVRHGAKIRAVQRNAAMVVDLAKAHRSAGAFFAGWPSTDFVGLLDYLNTHGDRLGGRTAQYFLRAMGVDGFVLSRDGVTALIEAGVIDKPPGGKRDMALIQAAYNRWSEESGLPLTHISRILAMSTGTIVTVPLPGAR